MPRTAFSKGDKMKAGNVKLGWNEQMNAKEFIVKVSGLVRDPVNMMREMEGDLYMSDFQKLSKAADFLHLASEEIKASSKLKE
jgi:hypothetical protein|tara:strand:+ start:371 stop:619 length:249 start_codon:yes stop_codon:yes gene_type:complete